MKFATASIAPLPPRARVGVVMSAAPERTEILSPKSLMFSAMAPGLPLLSLMPTRLAHSPAILSTMLGATV